MDFQNSFDTVLFNGAIQKYLLIGQDYNLIIRNIEMVGMGTISPEFGQWQIMYLFLN
jgi:hypothetical protein